MKTRPLIRHRHPGAFTLTELLVVILIIAVLAALSMTGIRQFRGAADKVVAIRNISQLQLANASYASDNIGKYMPSYSIDLEMKRTSWFDNTRFLSYINGDNVTVKSSKNQNTAPLSLMDPVVARAKKSGYDNYGASFGYNMEGFSSVGAGWSNPSTEASWHVSQLVSPDKSCAFITCTDWLAKYSGRLLWKGDTAAEGQTGNGKIAYRHQGGKAVVVYYDGHVGEISMKEIEALDQIADATRKGNKNLFWDADGK